MDILLAIWEQFHHILHIERKPIMNPRDSIMLQQEPSKAEPNILGTPLLSKSKEEALLIKEKKARIAELDQQIEEQDKIIDKLKKELCSLKSEMGKSKSTKRIPSNPVLPLDDEEISILEPLGNKKEIPQEGLKRYMKP